MPYERLKPTFAFTHERLKALEKLVPEAIADGKIDWEALREALGENLEEEGKEHYAFTWPGKRDAKRMAARPPQGTLAPATGEGVDERATKNIFIEGDNLEVLKLLQKSYAKKVKMIYIDPPYNTGKDMVYKDNFEQPLEEYLKLTGQMDVEGVALTTNKQGDGRFHSVWLNMMYPRLKLATSLLREDGAIFISCDENEMVRLRIVMDEIFGPENFVAEMVWAAGRKNDSTFVSISHEYIICYVRDKALLKAKKIEWLQKKTGLEDIYAQHERLLNKYGDDYAAITQDLKAWFRDLAESHPAKAHKHFCHVDKRGIYFPDNISWPGGGGPKYEVLHPKTKKPVTVPSRGWMTSDPKKMLEWIKDDRVHFGETEDGVPCIKSYLKDREYQAPYSVFYQDGRAATKRLRDLMDGDCFDFPKDEGVLQTLVEMLTGKDDLILDYFAGSGTTGHAVLAQNAKDRKNRRYILVQLPEPLDPDNKDQAAAASYCDKIRKLRNIAELTKERLRRAGKKISRENKPQAIDTGFKVYKLEKSNFREWRDYAGADLFELTNKMAEVENPLVDGWKKEALLTEILLQKGFPLDSSISSQSKSKKNEVLEVASPFCEHKLFVCLDKKIEKETIASTALNDKDVFVCLDSALTDEQKVRLSDKGFLSTI